jgi:hypothetical protein
LVWNDKLSGAAGCPSSIREGAVAGEIAVAVGRGRKNHPENPARRLPRSITQSLTKHPRQIFRAVVGHHPHPVGGIARASNSVAVGFSHVKPDRRHYLEQALDDYKHPTLSHCVEQDLQSFLARRTRFVSCCKSATDSSEARTHENPFLPLNTYSNVSAVSKAELYARPI